MIASPRLNFKNVPRVESDTATVEAARMRAAKVASSFVSAPASAPCPVSAPLPAPSSAAAARIRITVAVGIDEIEEAADSGRAAK